MKVSEQIHRTVHSYQHMDADTFRSEAAGRYQPAVFKGAFNHWRAVAQGRHSQQQLIDYLRGLDSGEELELFVGSAEMGGKFFYNEKLNGFNFHKEKASLHQLLERIVSQQQPRVSEYLYAGSVPLKHVMPQFLRDNPMDWLERPVHPRIWIGNKTTAKAHFDQSDNIAIAVYGKRRFTLFPPEQIANMYPGPIDYTVAGPQLSMVDFEQPDLQQHPRFAKAMESAQVVDLEPGDAIYIPSLWWHHVEACDDLNVLVNYWWSTQYGPDSPLATLIHGLMTMRNLSDGEKQAWRALFDHYLFQQNGDPVAHLPAERQGVLGKLNPKNYFNIKGFFTKLFNAQGR